jgi:hypothetical protein
VLAPVHLVLEGDHAEVTELRGQRGLGDPPHQPLVGQPIGHDLGDGDEPEVVAAGELLQLGPPGHGAVVVHDLADHAGGRQPREPRQVHGGLGLAHAPEDAAGHRAEGEDVAGSAQVAGPGVRIHQELDGPGPVGGADARGHAEARVGVHAHRERRPEGLLVLVGHEREAQLVRAGLGERGADQPAGVGRHEVDDLGRALAAAQTRSPSFSRSSSSATMTILPARMSRMALHRIEHRIHCCHPGLPRPLLFR